jgi:D-xylose transport system substrate-binding protein
MRLHGQRLLAVGAAIVAMAAACGNSSTGGTTTPKGKIGVLLPDTQSSARWEGDDRKDLTAAFQAAGLASSDFIIQNAGGSASQQQTQAEQAITNGATVLLLVNLDSGSGATIEKNAQAKGVKTIDYDRLTLNGTSDYYVSFDNVSVGKLQGEGLVKCLTDMGTASPKIAELNGSPTDNNATLFKQGYDSVLQPKYDAKAYTKVADQSVPAWDNQQALTIFEQMITANPSINGVLAANDGLGNAVVDALKTRKLNGKVPVTGQDATAQGIQNIIAGDQCMTVYKAIKGEADAAAKLAVELRNGQTPGEATGSVNNGTKDVKSVLLTPVSVTKANIKDTVIKDGFRTLDEICPPALTAACTAAGLK